MSLNTVTVTWNELDIGQAPLGGYVSFQLSAPAADSADGLTIEAEPAKPYFFTTATGSSDPLVANDNANLAPAGSYYLVTVAIRGQVPYTFKTLINFANGASQTLAFLYANQAVPAAQFAQYVPLLGHVNMQGPLAPLDTSLIDNASVTVTAGANAYTLLMTGTVGATRTVTLSPGLDGQNVTLLLVQPASGGPCGVTWSGVDWGRSLTPPALSTNANAADLLGFQYRTALGAWRYMGVN